MLFIFTLHLLPLWDATNLRVSAGRLRIGVVLFVLVNVLTKRPAKKGRPSRYHHFRSVHNTFLHVASREFDCDETLCAFVVARLLPCIAGTAFIQGVCIFRAILRL